MEPTKVEPLSGLPFKDRILALLWNISLDQKWLRMTNAASHVQPGLIFVDKAGAHPSGAPYVTPLLG